MRHLFRLHAAVFGQRILHLVTVDLLFRQQRTRWAHCQHPSLDFQRRTVKDLSSVFTSLHFRHRSRSKQRRGVAAVEFAVCVPILTLVVFGAIELGNGIYAKQAGTAAAYEAARIASATGGTELEARSRADAVLQSLQITGAVITISPPVDATLARGTMIQVSVSIPSEDNSGGLAMIMPGREIVSNVTMIKQ